MFFYIVFYNIYRCVQRDAGQLCLLRGQHQYDAFENHRSAQDSFFDTRSVKICTAYIYANKLSSLGL